MKLDIKQMANMSQLFKARTDEELYALENQLGDEARRAGVYREAAYGGLTREQWEIVRNPREILKAAVLAAGK